MSKMQKWLIVLQSKVNERRPDPREGERVGVASEKEAASP